jgi:hypothetical protein
MVAIPYGKPLGRAATLWPNKLDDHQMMFAMGESNAHLHYLQYQGKVRRIVDERGVRRFLRN